MSLSYSPPGGMFTIPNESIDIVTRWPKILQNNSKGAGKNIFWPRDFGGRTAPNFDQKWQRRGRKTFSNCF